ncbi:MAG: hypothetical protein OHK0036_11830 [Bacteroidia bacterium]
MKKKIEAEVTIRSIVRAHVEAYAVGFSERHLSELNDPEGTLNMKIHNVFIASLGEEIQYYSALARSLDSSLGNMLEAMAINIAKLFYEVHTNVEGYITSKQINLISNILEGYTRNIKKPEISDYINLRNTKGNVMRKIFKKKSSDYYLIDKENNEHHLIELKIGGDLDNKKARSEKEAILEQYAILSNSLPEHTKIYIYFATAYNRYGEGKPWQQSRVLQFFAQEELLIGRDFWNFICKSDKGYEVVLDEYKKSAPLIVSALNKIKKAYLK